MRSFNGFKMALDPERRTGILPLFQPPRIMPMFVSVILRISVKIAVNSFEDSQDYLFLLIKISIMLKFFSILIFSFSLEHFK